MDLFEKIDQFEKLANEIVDQADAEDNQTAETIEDSAVLRTARRNSAKNRIKKLSALIKR